MQNKIHIINGPSFVRNSIRKQIIEDLKISFPTIISLFNADVKEIGREINSSSLFDNLRVVRIVGISDKKCPEEAFRSFIKAKETGCVIIIEEEDVKKYDNLVKKLTEIAGDKNCLAQHPYAPPLKPKEFVEFVMTSGVIVIDKIGAECLVGLCGQDVEIIYAEMKKLEVLYGESPISKREVLSAVNSSVDGELLDVYMSIMYGNTSQAISVCRELSSSMGFDPVYGTVLKVIEAAVIISLFDGDSKEAFEFTKKKRPEILRKKSNMFLWKSDDKSEKSPSATPFLYRVGQKVYDRIGNKKAISGLFIRCYDSFVTYRRSTNESLASSNLDEIIASIC